MRDPSHSAFLLGSSNHHQPHATGYAPALPDAAASTQSAPPGYAGLGSGDPWGDATPLIPLTTIQHIGDVQAFARTLEASLSRYIIGHRNVIHLLALAVLTEKHILLADDVGTGKSTALAALAASLGLSRGKFTCHADLTPSQMTGFHHPNPLSGALDYFPGPLNNAIVLCDEFNRASEFGKGQIIGAMSERGFALDNRWYTMPYPGMVIAAMNPHDAGTFPLTRSELDRFCFATRVGYLQGDDRRRLIARASSSTPTIDIPFVPLLGDDLRRREDQLHACVRVIANQVAVADVTQEYVYAIIEAIRNNPKLQFHTASDRAVPELVLAARAEAACCGLDVVDDRMIHAVIRSVLPHRVQVANHEDPAWSEAETILAEILKHVPAPRGVKH